MKELAAALGTAALLFTPLISSAAINSLGGQTGNTQTFATSTGSISPHLLIQSNSNVHTFRWDGTPWLLNQGGTGATSFATGSIPFINNGVFSQDNTNLFWDAVNTIFNVGGSTTSSKFFVKGSGTLNLLTLANASGTSMFSVSRFGTTTAANGINITGGCFAKNGVCLTTGGSGSGTVSSSTAGYIAYYPLTGTTVGGNSSIFLSSNKIGFNTTSPQATVDINGAYYSRIVTATSSTINWDLGNVQQLTLASSPTLSFIGGHGGGVYDLILTQDGTGSRTVTWPASVVWPGGTAPTLSTAAGAVDTVHFIYDGTNYLGTFNLNYAAAPPPPSIAFDSSPDEVDIGGTNTTIVSNPITVSGSHPILLCALFSNQPLTSLAMTYDGSSMTQVGSTNNYSGADNIYLFGLLSPTTGTSTAATATWDSINAVESIHCASYSGVSQSALPTVTQNDGANTASSFNASITTDSTANSWVAIYARNSFGTFTAGSNFTIRNQTAGTGIAWADSNGTVPTSASYTQSASWGTGTSWGTIQVQLKPY
ncbi:MAG: hypothetical protein V4436_01965 [Patescibacteria group bacterium]